MTKLANKFTEKPTTWRINEWMKEWMNEDLTTSERVYDLVCRQVPRYEYAGGDFSLHKPLRGQDQGKC